MNFCAQCGAPVSQRIPEGDHLPRYVCDHCHTVHYQNPKIVAGCLATFGDRLLICRRAIEPRHGYWTLPAGFMELGETVAAAAARETWEEACASVTIGELYTVVNVPQIGQVHMMYRGELDSETHSAGVESLESKLIAPADIPWQSLAFPSVRFTLARYLEDLGRNEFPLHTATVIDGEFIDP